MELTWTNLPEPDKHALVDPELQAIVANRFNVHDSLLPLKFVLPLVASSLDVLEPLVDLTWIWTVTLESVVGSTEVVMDGSGQHIHGSYPLVLTSTRLILFGEDPHEKFLHPIRRCASVQLTELQEPTPLESSLLASPWFKVPCGDRSVLHIVLTSGMGKSRKSNQQAFYTSLSNAISKAN